MSWISSLIGGGVIKSVEKLASEWIQTDMESAEAKSLMIKTLDPNGKMRRDLSRFACRAYGFYLIAMVGLSFMVAFSFGDVEGASEAANMLSGLFLPITTSWAAIVSASFGVQASNVIKGAK
tara:strand:- start:41 stop:406 length:366 start_codon:yes stop_codon:yes gene_type:complete